MNSGMTVSCSQTPGTGALSALQLAHCMLSAVCACEAVYDELRCKAYVAWRKGGEGCTAHPRRR